ncbi:ribosome biogenesis factor YjgA [Cognatilysobacter terrigena]|uniref:ribosome biogenesis factor YjgA n=1 Tax=Cognatilysobacter terrigena TaxID=2488749 RepID=UPI00105D593F|nr:ribosome biogenesis factor YjgA [Lysobacter terrigena]
MRGRDEETGEFHSPSRSEQRREALGVLDLAETLAGLTDAQLARVPVPESITPHILDTRRITSNIARKRQLAFLAKQMRKLDDEELQAMRDALDEKSESSRAEVAAMHRVEAWRTKLLDGGDAALAELLDLHPDADRQRLRQLVRNALDERNRNKPPRAFRELFRELRGVMLGTHDDEGDDSLDVDDTDD